jgi:hypothetical protein
MIKTRTFQDAWFLLVFLFTVAAHALPGFPSEEELRANVANRGAAITFTAADAEAVSAVN